MALLTSLRWALAAVLLILVGVAVEGAAQHREHEVRAAFVYNFAKFVDWPEGSLPADRFTICVAGDPRVASALDTIIAGEIVRGRALERADAATADAARRCQILYLGQPDDRTARLLASVRGNPVLTVGDSPRFLELGGAVRFLQEDGRVRFDVNMAVVNQAGLEMGTNLLRVARQVEGIKR